LKRFNYKANPSDGQDGNLLLQFGCYISLNPTGATEVLAEAKRICPVAVDAETLLTNAIVFAHIAANSQTAPAVLAAIRRLAAAKQPRKKIIQREAYGN
jgi:hypothetical protein